MTFDHPTFRASHWTCLVFASVLLLSSVAHASCTDSDHIAPASVVEVAPGNFVRLGLHELMTPANRGGIANIGFIVGDKAVAVVDSGGSACDGLRLRAAIRARTPLPIRYVIATHVHPDHVLGHAAFLQDGADFVGHARLPGALSQRGVHYLEANKHVFGPTPLKTQIIVPKRLVDDRLVLNLGGRELTLQAWNTAHTDNDLTVFDKSTGTLWAGDLLFAGHLPVLDGNLVGWLRVMDALARIPARRVIPGHGNIANDWPAALEPQRRYLAKLAADLRRQIRNGKSMSEAVVQTPIDAEESWKLTDEFHARNVTAGFAELEWE